MGSCGFVLNGGTTPKSETPAKVGTAITFRGFQSQKPCFHKLGMELFMEARFIHAAEQVQESVWATDLEGAPEQPTSVLRTKFSADGPA